MIVFIRDYVIDDLLIYYLFGMFFYIIVRTIYIILKKKSFVWKRELLYLVFAGYLVIVFSATVMPKWYENTIDGVTHIEFIRNEPTFNFVPFRSIIYFFTTSSSDNSMINLFVNIFLLFPFGVLFPVVFPQNGKKTILYGALLSVLIEFLQIIPGRSTDIDDFILNVTGCALGYAIWLMRKRYRLQRFTYGKYSDIISAGEQNNENDSKK